MQAGIARRLEAGLVVRDTTALPLSALVPRPVVTKLLTTCFIHPTLMNYLRLHMVWHINTGGYVDIDGDGDAIYT